MEGMYAFLHTWVFISQDIGPLLPWVVFAIWWLIPLLWRKSLQRVPVLSFPGQKAWEGGPTCCETQPIWWSTSLGTRHLIWTPNPLGCLRKHSRKPRFLTEPCRDVNMETSFTQYQDHEHERWKSSSAMGGFPQASRKPLRPGHVWHNLISWKEVLWWHCMNRLSWEVYKYCQKGRAGLHKPVGAPAARHGATGVGVFPAVS